MAATIQDVIMLFGDSTTQGGWEPGLDGFATRLSHVYARKLDILNRGLSGYNTDWAKPVFERCLAAKRDQLNAPKIRILTIWFGANDACIKPSPQHVPLDRFVTNLKEFIDMVQDEASPYYSPATRIVLISPPPVNTHQRLADLQSRDPPVALDRDFRTTRSYADAVKGVAHAKNVAFVDIWTPLWEGAGMRESDLTKYLNDGLHLNAAGYEVLYEALINVIGERYPEVHFDNLPSTFPPWVDIANLKG
ncbi:GDSL Lipase/Acylhydrolase [Collybia nuda]|uniref:GDSL Lipase/Acylhydrolase n=1 Tax=Collybia nuda TaxID=64659 RepID=A0A9P5YCH4_9AGAR|nr:GDSL Lipase/Acylhydrolase [Collybia nuda]